MKVEGGLQSDGKYVDQRMARGRTASQDWTSVTGITFDSGAGELGKAWHCFYGPSSVFAYV